ASAGASARVAIGALAPKRAARFVRPDDRPHEFGPAAKPAGPRKSPALYAARFVQFNPFGRNVVLPRRLDLAKERIVQSRAGIAGEPAAAGPRSLHARGAFGERRFSPRRRSGSGRDRGSPSRAARRDSPRRRSPGRRRAAEAATTARRAPRPTRPRP